MRIYSLFNLRSLSSESKYHPSTYSTTKIHKSIKYVTKGNHSISDDIRFFADTKRLSIKTNWKTKIIKNSIFLGTYPQNSQSRVVFILQLVSLCMFFRNTSHAQEARFAHLANGLSTNVPHCDPECDSGATGSDGLIQKHWSKGITGKATYYAQSVCLSVMHFSAGSFGVRLLIDLEECRRFGGRGFLALLW